MRAIVLSALIATTSAAHAAVLNCKLAHSAREKAVCASPSLLAKDRQMGTAYAALHARLSAASFSVVQSDQRNWLTYLDASCPAHGLATGYKMPKCLGEKYDNRLNDLKLIHGASGSLTLFTRAHYFTVPASADDLKNRPPYSPGFGDYVYRWPQWDQPDAAHAGWNAAIAAYVLSLTANTDRPHPSSLEQAAVANQAITLDFAVRGSNAHYIVVEFQQFYEGFGAHPLTSIREHTYNLATQRALDATDVFSGTSGWATALQPVAYARLKAQPDLSPYILDDSAPKGVVDGLGDTAEWILTPNRFTLRFAQYQVAAYVAGMPSVHFTWAELKPYLNPAFHPETLPTLSASPF